MLKLYSNIKSRRQALGLNQEQLAHLMGYSDKGMISRIESGQVDISHSKIIEFAKVLQTTPRDLMGWDEQEDEYYLNDNTRKIAQEIFDNKELGLLFDAAKDAAPEDLQTVHTMLMALKSKEGT
jgi:transcriptional regulator with XRE-family HTH domain